MFAHAHNEVGWKSKYMDIYDGNQNSYYFSSVDEMLSQVVISLEEDPNRHFTYAELTFFKIWFEK